MLNFRQVEGDNVTLTATHKSHFGYSKDKLKAGKEDDFITSFADAFKDAFYKVNDLQRESNELTRALT